MSRRRQDFAKDVKIMAQSGRALHLQRKSIFKNIKIFVFICVALKTMARSRKHIIILEKFLTSLCSHKNLQNKVASRCLLGRVWIVHSKSAQGSTKKNVHLIAKCEQALKHLDLMFPKSQKMFLIQKFCGVAITHSPLTRHSLQDYFLIKS